MCRSDALARANVDTLQRAPDTQGLDTARFSCAPGHVMAGTLEHLRARYGSISGFLTAAGFDEVAQQRMRSCLQPDD